VIDHALKFVFELPDNLPSPMISADSVDAEAVREALISKGVDVLFVQWHQAGLLRLPTEDDATFICEAYLELLELSQVATGGNHRAFLGDGRLQVEAEVRPDFTRARQIYAPFHRKALGKKIDFEIETKKYVRAWAQLVAAIVRLADAPNPK
jgi:hypothetical protein